LITVGIYLAKTGSGSTQDSPNRNILKLEPSDISSES
jgi:hypothetical protein